MKKFYSFFSGYFFHVESSLFELYHREMET